MDGDSRTTRHLGAIGCGNHLECLLSGVQSRPRVGFRQCPYQTGERALANLAQEFIPRRLAPEVKNPN
jgi:hypothetical protein